MALGLSTWIAGNGIAEIPGTIVRGLKRSADDKETRKKNASHMRSLGGSMGSDEIPRTIVRRFHSKDEYQRHSFKDGLDNVISIGLPSRNA